MRRARTSLVLATAFVAVTAGASVAHAKKNGAEFEAALVRCADVNTPAGLAGCGADPLAKGEAHINKRGDVSVAIKGALASTTYDIVYRSFSGASATDLPIGQLTTDALGRGSLEKKGFFALTDTGAGTIVFKQGGADQFLSGFTGAGEPEGLEAGLVRCGDVNKSAALATCGTDPLGSGSAEVEEGGGLDVKVSKAAPNVKYEVNFRLSDGTAEVSLGTFTTDAAGKGKLEIDAAFAAGAIGAGNIVVKRDGDTQDQFISGFSVSEQSKGKAEETRFRVALIRCLDVNKPAALATCGIDTLFKGFAELDEKGNVKVVLVRAEPQTAYDVVFRALDGVTDIPIGTLTTNPAGNANFQQKKFFTLNDVISGNIVVKRGGFDQFLTGVKVIK